MADTLTTLTAIVAFLAFIGNVLITLVGLKLPAHPKNLTQVFLISLSGADIILSLQVPFYVMGLQNENGDEGDRGRYFKEPYEDTSNALKVFCSISSFLLWTTVKANIFMVMIMGFDRMAATCYAATYLKKVKRQYAIVACTVVWILSLFLAALPGVIAAISKEGNPYSYDKRFNTCTPFPDFCRSGTSMSHFLVYFLIEVVVTFLVPLICITICYFLICSKIFNLKKIRTISRHFSKKQIFKSGKNDKSKQSKSPPPEEGPSKDSLHNQKSKSYVKENNLSFAVIPTDDQIAKVGKKVSRQENKQKISNSEAPNSGFKINVNQAAASNSGFKINVNQTPAPASFRINTHHDTSEHQISKVSVYPIENNPRNIKFNLNQTSSKPKFGLYPDSSQLGVECNDQVIPDPPSSSQTFSFYRPSSTNAECCDESLDLPNQTHQSPEPKQYPIDPNLQRRRFNFFTSEGDDQFAECPEPGSKPGILASSINVIEKHYNAIEAAQKELAKKMRVYKYQIRVARTAVVVCTFFFVCYLVYEIGTLYVIWGVDCHDSQSRVSKFVNMSHMFLFLNSALNVLVYGLMHRTVRANLSKICAACTGKSNSSST
ncbi:hypothetical protein ACHWQZ_G019094 [Mnemiopsis leidyi]